MVNLTAYSCEYTHLTDFLYFINIPSDNTIDLAEFLQVEAWYMEGKSPNQCRINQTEYSPELPDEYLLQANQYQTILDTGGDYCGYQVRYTWTGTNSTVNLNIYTNWSSLLKPIGLVILSIYGMALL